MKKRVACKNMSQREVEIICNVCGEEISNDSFGRLDNYISLKKKWGYGTKFDGEKHSLEICEACYDRFLESLLIPVRREI